MSTRVIHSESSATNGGVLPGHRLTALEAGRRHWLLVLIPTLLGLIVGLAVANERAPTYKAEARLAVGRIDISAAGAVGSFAIAAEKLASQYSRAIDAERITAEVARRAGISQSAARGRLSATPVPQSPVVRVFATGRDAADARRLADIASDALIAYTTALNRSNPDTPRLLKRFRAELLHGERIAPELRKAKRRYRGAHSKGNLRRLQNLRVDARISRLRAENLRTAYSASTSSQAATTLLTVLQRATPAKSDRDRWLQFLGFLGAAAGLALGFALATLRGNRRARI